MTTPRNKSFSPTPKTSSKSKIFMILKLFLSLIKLIPQPLYRCLAEDPTQRISARAALKHNFFTAHQLMPSIKDMVLLPSNVLQLLNVLDDPKYENEEEVKGNNNVSKSCGFVQFGG